MAELVERSETVLAEQDLSGLMRAWSDEVRSRTGSDRTPTEYKRLVERFLDRVGWNYAISTPPTATVQAFANGPGPSGKTPSASTRIVRLAALRSYFDFARRMGAPVSDPTADVKRPRKDEAAPRGLDTDEIKRLLGAIPTNRPSGLRDRAIVVVMTFMGLRRSEALSIRVGDLSRNGAVYMTWRAKGGKVRRREIPAPAFHSIVTALEAEGRDLVDLPPDDFLFRVSGNGFARNLARYARKAGLARVTPHAIRHSCAKLRRRTGASLEDVQAVLGHDSLSTTSRYLKQLEGEDDAGWRAAAAEIGL